jgi:oxygen-dependent protoporphyrinogen oxidase
VTSAGIAIIGGGISGLSAAWTLHQRGIPYRLLEAGPSLGGVIRTEEKDGFILEGGPDSILAQKPEGIALCRELGLGDRLIPTNPDLKAIYILHRRKMHPLPEGMMLAVPTRILPMVRSGLFSWPGKLRMGLDLVRPAGPQNGDESIATFLRRRFGQEAVERLGEPLLAGIHAGDPERLSILATFPRFRELEAKYGSLVRGMLSAPRPKRKPGAPAPAAFYSLRGGLRELVDALVARLDPASIRTGAVVRSLTRNGDGFTIGLDSGETVSAPKVIVAAPGPKIAPALQGLLPEVSRTLAAVPFASSATVLLGYRRADVAHSLDGYGMVVPRGEGLRTTALSFVSTKFAHRAPEGHVLLRAFLGGVRDPGVLDLTDEEMVQAVERDMTPILGLKGRPSVTRVFRWPGGTPQLEVGHLERMRAVESAVAEVPGLHLTGAGIWSTGIPDSVADATRVAVAAAENAR